MGLHEEIICAGFGGQGVLALGRLLAYSAMLDDKNVSWLPSYGPEMRGGTANCNVILSDELIGCPIISKADTLIAMNRPSLDKFEDAVKPGGRILINSSLIDRKVEREDVDVYLFPVNEVALECGSGKTANMVMLGAYTALKGFPPKERILDSFLKVFGESKRDFLPLNQKALEQGMGLVS